MRFEFSLLKSSICALLVIGMCWASVWQWDRHLQKQALIQKLQDTLREEPIELSQLLSSSNQLTSQIWRRVRFSGVYDFEHEVIVHRNRGEQDRAGFHVITPLKLDNSSQYILIDRGFIPLGRESLENRKRYQSPARVAGYGLVKASMPPKFLAPPDPPAGNGAPWVDRWIRVDIDKMRAQLPYPLLPMYLEIMENPEDPLLSSKIVKQGAAGKNDVLALTGQKQTENFGMESPDIKYPIPWYDTTPPPDIHLGYVFEWAFMALLTLGIGFIIQRKRA